MAESINAAIRRHERLAEKHQNIVDALVEKATWCPECKAWYETDKCSEACRETHERGVVLMADCGYGDDDLLGDVTYNEYWRVCPKGHMMEMVTRHQTSVTNQHYRT